MLSQQDLFFFLAALGQGVSGQRLVEAVLASARDAHLDLPAMLLHQAALNQDDIERVLQALHACLERRDWRKEAALAELVQSAGPERLEACWEAALAWKLPPVERYQERRLHAEGGLGRVWQARDPIMGRVVALKDIRPELADRTAVLLRFIQEARITSQLEHPHIIPVYDLHQGQGVATPYYTMRFISGRTLQDAIQEFHAQPAASRWTSVPFQSLLTVFVQVCDAIAHAHSRGIIHRDLKPANVALGEFNAVMVVDWGLARRLDEADDPASIEMTAEQQDHTRAGDVLGTPAYMAPEQAEGARDRIGPATDVYGLGSILFAILTGRPPHLQQPGESMADLFRRIASEESPAVRTIQADVPPALAAVCRRAMARAPEARYAGPSELAADIQRWLGGHEVSVYPERWVQRAGRWLRQHPAFTQAAASIALLMIVSASVLITNAWAAERTLMLLVRSNLEQEARSLGEIYQTRLDDLIRRAQLLGQYPLLADLPRAPSEAEPRQRAEDTLRAIFHHRPEYLDIGVARRQPWTWAIRLTRDQPGEEELRGTFGQPVMGQELLRFLEECERLKQGQAHIAIVPPPQPGVAAQLWVGVRGRAGGVVFLAADLQQLLQTPTSIGLGGGYIHIADAAGTILTRPIEGEAHAAFGKIQAHNPSVAPYFAAQPLPEAGMYSIEEQTPQLTACRRLMLGGGDQAQALVLLVERPLDAQAQESARAHQLVIGLTALLIVGALAATYGLVRVLARSRGLARA